MATRANIEQELVARIGAWMSTAGMAITTAGANASLNSPIGWAIRVAGGTVSDPALVTDADVATVSDFNKMAALAELRTLESVLSNYAGVDKKAGPVEIKSSQFADRLMMRIAALRHSIAIEYGVGASTFDSLTSFSVAHQVAW